MIEYGSVSCPHCAHFAADVFPEFKTKWVDTGKVRYIFRETPIHDNIDIAAFMVVRCTGPKNYFAAIDAFFKGQDELFKTKDVDAMAGQHRARQTRPGQGQGGRLHPERELVARRRAGPRTTQIAERHRCRASRSTRRRP